MDVLDEGAGRAVVLIPGAGAPASALDPLAAALSSRRRVLRPALPGYGHASPLPATSGLDAVHDAIERAVAARGVSEAGVVGWSLGAYHALALALRGRLRVTRLALLAPLAAFPPEQKPAIDGFVAALRRGADVGDALVARMLAPGFAAAHPAARDEVRGWQRACPPEVLAWELEAFARAADLRPDLGRLRVPVAIRVGAEDAACPPALARELVAALPDAAATYVPRVGHALLVEDLEPTIAWVAAALDAPVRA